MNTTTRRPRARRGPFDIRNDDGSLLLVILFTLIMTSLVLVATATMLSGLTKTRASRDYAIALQAADIAFADALLRANRGGFILPPNTRTSGTPVEVPGTGVKWAWTATRTSTRSWLVEAEAVGKTVDRHFKATLTGTQVKMGRDSISTGVVRYFADRSENWQNGFFGSDTVAVAGTARPIIEGYDGQIGTVGSNGPLTLGSAQVERINEYNWTTDAGRCTGTACTSAYIDKIPDELLFDETEVTAACFPATRLPVWRATDNILLIAGRCYQRLIFDEDHNQTMVGTVYADTAGVTINAGVQVNTFGNYLTAPASGMRIASRGNFDQNAGSKVALAVYNPTSVCQITGASDLLYQTVFMGAATCKRINIAGNIRMRYDGGLEPFTGANPIIWNLRDYHAID